LLVRYYSTTNKLH